MNTPEAVASIQLYGRSARAWVRVIHAAGTWTVDVLSPEGPQDALLGEFDSRDAALDAIQRAWSDPTWVLQWV